MAPSIPSLLIDYTYPATLTMIGVWANDRILGAHIQAGRDEIVGQMHPDRDEIVGLNHAGTDDLWGQIDAGQDDLSEKINEIKVDLEVVKKEIKALTIRQKEMEMHNMAVAERILKNHGKN